MILFRSKNSCGPPQGLTWKIFFLKSFTGWVWAAKICIDEILTVDLTSLCRGWLSFTTNRNPHTHLYIISTLVVNKTNITHSGDQIGIFQFRDLFFYILYAVQVTIEQGPCRGSSVPVYWVLLILVTRIASLSFL